MPLAGFEAFGPHCNGQNERKSAGKAMNSSRENITAGSFSTLPHTHREYATAVSK